MQIATLIVTDGISPATQDPPSGTSNLYDVIVNIDGLNDCDEFDAGDNNVDCINEPNYLVGPVSQTNILMLIQLVPTKLTLLPMTIC